MRWGCLLFVLVVLGACCGLRNVSAANDAPATQLAGPPVGIVLAQAQSAPIAANVDPPDNNAVAWVPWVLLIQCILIVGASLAGGWLPQFVNLSHTRMQLMMSFVGGLMLGIGLFHMLPHAVTKLGSLDRAIWWMVTGLLSMFCLLRTFHFHHHEVGETAGGTGHQHDHGHDHDHDHGHLHGEDYDNDLAAGHRAPGHGPATHELSWAGVAFGLSLHTFIDGTALAASVQGDALHHAPIWMLGLGTFLAVVLHKPLDAVSITSLMASGGWSPNQRNTVNAGFAFMCPLGATVFLGGVQYFADVQQVIVGCALAFSAGVFLCISMSDLLPELEFHAHDRLKLSLALMLGVAVAYGIGMFEPEHAHSHAATKTVGFK